MAGNALRRRSRPYSPPECSNTPSPSPPLHAEGRERSLIDNFKVSAQWSRRMNSLKLWLTFRVHGRQAYEE